MPCSCYFRWIYISSKMAVFDICCLIREVTHFIYVQIVFNLFFHTTTYCIFINPKICFMRWHARCWCCWLWVDMWIGSKPTKATIEILLNSFVCKRTQLLVIFKLRVIWISLILKFTTSKLMNVIYNLHCTKMLLMLPYGLMQ